MKRLLLTTAAIAGMTASFAAAPASAQPYYGEVRMFANTYCPRNWAETDGQILAISSNPALYSLIGTMYGGNGVSTFGLPDIRGRSPMHLGTGPGLTTRFQGQMLGFEDVILTVAEMPSHNHLIRASSAAANTGSLNGGGWGDFGAAFDAFNAGGLLDQTARSDAVSSAGGNQPHYNMQPNTVLRFCINLSDGVYPPRN
ncbi:MAG: tail fiber protein [Pseudomonadota bacterium]